MNNSKDFQIVYVSEKNNSLKIHWLFKEEAKAMKNLGIMVGTKPNPDATRLLYRGTIILKKDNYPNDKRFLQSFDEYINYAFLSKYYPFISDLTIETFFVNNLNRSTENLIKEKGWSKAFIKNDIKSLEHIEEGKSVWPYTSFDEMHSLFEKMPFHVNGKYAIRKYVDPKILKKELRYWVLNGQIYRRDNIIPDIVKQAAERLNKLGSKYYTIDATPELIIEVNPGESSDRHGENSAELFASWFKEEFDS